MSFLQNLLTHIQALFRAWMYRVSSAQGRGKLAWLLFPIVSVCACCTIGLVAISPKQPTNQGIAATQSTAGTLVSDAAQPLSTATTEATSVQAVSPPTVVPTLLPPTAIPPTATAVPTPAPTEVLPSPTSEPTEVLPSPTVEPTEVLPSPTAEPAIASSGAYPIQPANLALAAVERVIDGDTVDVVLDGQTVRLRLIGIDTPETKDSRTVVQCFGREASAEAERLLNGQTVALEADPSQDERDSYGRLLRYVWLPDGKLFNLEMVVGGFAHEYTYNVPYKYQAAFQQAESDSRGRGWGLWAVSTCNGDTKQAADVAAAPPAQQAPAPTKAPVAVEQPAAPAQDVGSAPCAAGQIKGNRNSSIYHVPGQQAYATTYKNVQCFDTEAQAKAAGYRKAKR